MPLPKPTGGTGRGKGTARPQFLKAEHVKSPTVVTITKMILESTEYSDVQLAVLFPDKTSYILGLRFNSPNYRTLFQEFGDDETKWKGKKFTVSSVYSESLEQDVLRVSADTKT